MPEESTDHNGRARGNLHRGEEMPLDRFGVGVGSQPVPVADLLEWKPGLEVTLGVVSGGRERRHVDVDCPCRVVPCADASQDWSSWPKRSVLMLRSIRIPPSLNVLVYLGFRSLYRARPAETVDSVF